MIKYIFLLLSIFFLISCQENTKTNNEKNSEFWIWFTANSTHTDQDLENMLKKISDVGIYNLLINANKNKLERTIELAKKYNVNVHVWFITMNSRGIGKTHPEWLSVNKLGKSLSEEKAYVNYYKFVCPAIPEARQHIKNQIEELCQIEGLKGIHMDYIRYVDAILPIGLWPKYDIVQDKVYPQFDYGYHPYLRNKYKEKYGIEPIDIQDPENDTLWNQFRYNQVTEFVFQIDSLTKKYNKSLTAAVFPTPKMAAKMVYQDWGKWPLIIAFPMLYHNFYNEDIDWIGEMVDEGIKTCHPKTQIVSGIFAPDLKETNEITKAVEVSLRSGAKGVSIFGLNPLDEDKRWIELKNIIQKYRK